MILVPSPPKIVKESITDEIILQVATIGNQYFTPFVIDCEAEGESDNFADKDQYYILFGYHPES